MRVRRQIDIPSLMRLYEVVSLDAVVGSGDDEETTLADYIAAPEPPPDPNEIVSTEVFNRINPGRERICAVLLCEGYTQQAIASITGYSESQIRASVSDIRLKVRARSHPRPYRVWNIDTGVMRFAEELTQFVPKKRHRVMPWTGYLDTQHLPVYLWDIVRAHGQVKVVRHYFDTRDQRLSWTPFTGSDRDMWLADSRVIGNVYQNPELITEGGERP